MRLSTYTFLENYWRGSLIEYLTHLTHYERESDSCFCIIISKKPNDKNIIRESRFVRGDYSKL